ncbi:hypothetical protein GZH53_15855 [Flavihumibacter sp. R14]|nr:hypothetical protein [Flavihumibacter soli]
MLNSTVRINLPLTAGFKDAFPDKNNPDGLIPNNSVVDKGKPGFGLTYSEFRSLRHSIMTIPYLPIIDDKVTEHADFSPFKVAERVTPADVAEYLANAEIQFKKLVVTPEGFWKIIEAAKSLGIEDTLYDDFFCFLDECHCYACDMFREDILTPFKYFWSFKNKAMGSATPYPSSNPKFKELTYYKIEFDQKLGKISLVVDDDPKSALHYVLTHPESYPGNVFIFYNSVTAIGNAIATAGITDVNIYCRDDEKNMINLEEASLYYQSDTNAAQFKKFNFFTCRYNEGWDLRGEPLDTMVLVTDESIPHSIVGINFRGLQAVGRIRLDPEERPNQIIHITNTIEPTTMRTRESIEENVIYSAKKHIADYIKFKTDCREEDMTDILGFGDFVNNVSSVIDAKTIIDYEKIDQIVYKKSFKLQYRSKESIEEAWQNCNYETEIIKFSLKTIKRGRSAAEINREIIEQVELYNSSPRSYEFGKAQRQIKKWKEASPILFEAYHVLGVKTLEELGYNNDKMKAKLIEKSNKNQEARLHILVTERFEIRVYSKKEVKSILQGIYNELGLKKADGSKKTAFADDLDRLGLFKIELVKERTATGTRAEQIKIVKALYSIDNAA